MSDVATARVARAVQPGSELRLLWAREMVAAAMGPDGARDHVRRPLRPRHGSRDRRTGRTLGTRRVAGGRRATHRAGSRRARNKRGVRLPSRFRLGRRRAVRPIYFGAGWRIEGRSKLPAIIPSARGAKAVATISEISVSFRIAVPGNAFSKVGRLPSPNAEFCPDSGPPRARKSSRH
jgi:hypothetical protein